MPFRHSLRLCIRPEPSEADPTKISTFDPTAAFLYRLAKQKKEIIGILFFVFSSVF
jgi:hypothetical protein